jgi:hypothetical protein
MKTIGRFTEAVSFAGQSPQVAGSIESPVAGRLQAMLANFRKVQPYHAG